MAIFDITYVGDMPYLKLEGGTVTGATIFNSSVTANSGSITNNLAVGSINGVTVGSSPKFTDTTYSVATTSANGLLPALGGGTTNYLRADGAWAKPPGTTYSVATTSANGLMAAADKVAVNKIGSGTLNTTNKTIIPAINELKTTVDNSGGYIKTDKIILRAEGATDESVTLTGLTSVKGNFTITTSSLTANMGYKLYALLPTTSGITPNIVEIKASTTNYSVAWIEPTGDYDIISLNMPIATQRVTKNSHVALPGNPGVIYDIDSGYGYPMTILYPNCSFGIGGYVCSTSKAANETSSSGLSSRKIPIAFAYINGTNYSTINVEVPSSHPSDNTPSLTFNNGNTAEIAIYITYI